MSWRLDPTAPDSSRESASSKSSPGLDMHKLPKKLQSDEPMLVPDNDEACWSDEDPVPLPDGAGPQGQEPLPET